MGLDVGSLLSLLDEPDQRLKGLALHGLLTHVDSHWPSVSESLSKIEELAETESFPDKETACALASRCFFHLEEYQDATRLALGAGGAFDVNGESAYSKTIVGMCLETYCKHREGEDLDPRLEAIVERMFKQCYDAKNFVRAVGLGMEAKRLDKIREVVGLSKPDQREIISYALQTSLKFHTSEFSKQVMEMLVELYGESSEDDVNYLEWFICLHALQRVDEYAALLRKLFGQSKTRALIAYQAVFDLLEFQDQRFEKVLIESFMPPAPVTAAPVDATEGDEAVPAAAPAPPAPPAPAYDLDAEVESRMETLRSILYKGKKAALLLDFMYKRNGTDPLLLKRFKEASDAGRKNSVLHHAMIVAHGYAQCGTTADAYLRDNLEWLGRASNWAKFGATASLGVVHKGNVESAMSLLKPYLPQALFGGENVPGAGSPYSEGGALYALGLIHAAEGVSPDAKKLALGHLTNSLESASGQDSEVARDALLHGSCLGIGLTAMSSSDDALIDRLRNVLYADSAVTGEATAMSMGLVMLGGGHKHAAMLEDLLGYAHDTDHEKIVRAIGLCVALTYFGKEEEADLLIEQLSRDKDHLIRYGGVFLVACAYVGTANNAAIRKLLHITVSDVSNDVRRAAVICLGLVMIRLPDRLPGLIALLSESYNPHVRYGAALALGIGCSTQSDPKEALELLEPLLDDKTDFVRQGAMIAYAFLIAQVRPETELRAKKFREKIYAVLNDTKQASTMTRMGAILAYGIVDSGGRNSFLSLIGRNGLPKPPAIAGIVLWVQYWNWYPLMHMLSLSLSPSALIGVNSNLDLPKSFHVDCEGGEVYKRFGMPDLVEEKKEQLKTHVKTAVLSTTAKVTQKHKQKAAAAGPGMSSTPAPVEHARSTPAPVEAMEVEGGGVAPVAAAAAAAPSVVPVQMKKSVPEDATLLTNPIRVTKSMMEFVRYRSGDRYVPASGNGDLQKFGVVMLRDTQPDQDQDVIQVTVPPVGDISPNEPGPPAPFEWTPPEAR